jgi:hypothetical protein
MPAIASKMPRRWSLSSVNILYRVGDGRLAIAA